jgi:protein ImuB
MFACIRALDDVSRLMECAQAFSPVVERTTEDTVTLDANGLDRIYGPPQETAAAMSRRARELGFQAAVALASNPDTAICVARAFTGIHVVPLGDEAKYLEPLPLDLLAPGEELAETLERWGIRTFRDLAALPPMGIAGRLGAEGVRLQKLARGELERPLVPAEEPLHFEASMELEYPIELLEPLSFVLSRLLGKICESLEHRGMATNEVRLRLLLEDRSEHLCTLRLPVSMRDARTFLKLLQLDLGSHPPSAPIVAVRLAAEPAEPRVAQEGMFTPLSPEPEKLELTLARISALVGEQNVGSPELLDTHRPGAFRMTRFGSPRLPVSPSPRHRPALSFRLFRPPRYARVQVHNGQPIFVLAEGIRGKVSHVTGPWRTSGDWWRSDAWARDEWDVALEDGALYRLCCDHASGRWYVEGSYD